jgi:hypothetical protein
MITIVLAYLTTEQRFLGASNVKVSRLQIRCQHTEIA